MCEAVLAPARRSKPTDDCINQDLDVCESRMVEVLGHSSPQLCRVDVVASPQVSPVEIHAQLHGDFLVVVQVDGATQRRQSIQEFTTLTFTAHHQNLPSVACRNNHGYTLFA